MFERYRVIHFVGIGGIGMSGIAELLHNLGYEVTGSDLKDSETTRRLRELGIKVSIGHDAENTDNAHVVVISSAVLDDNPEVIEAKRKSLPVIPRAEMLAELARLKYGILVAGAHGKTTTTSLISTILAHCGFDPTVVIGGRLKATGSNARLGQGEFLVAEADESDGSFLKLSPTIAVVTNIDREHMDFFKTIDSLKKAFLSFMNKIPFYGVSIVCIENEHLRELLPSIHRRYITYGFTHDAELRAVNVRKGFMSMSFETIYRGKNIGEFDLPLTGTHNILNSLAAIGAALELQIDISKIREGLKSFEGIQRRFEFKGEVNGIKIFDDYGHHPTEIKAILKAAREGLLIRTQNTEYRTQKDAERGLSQIYGRSRRIGTVPEPEGRGRLFVVFQPHRYTRTKDLMDEFAPSFNDADSLILLAVYSAGEKPIKGANSETLLKRIKKAGHKSAVYITDKEKAIEHIMTALQRGDMLLTLGAGDVWKIGDEVLNKLKVKSEKLRKKHENNPPTPPFTKGGQGGLMDEKIWQETLSGSFRGEVKFMEPMKDHTSLRIGGPADIFAVPHDLQSLKNMTCILKREQIPFFTLGWGTNILVRDGGIEGAVISFHSFRKIEVLSEDEEYVRLSVEAGTPLQRLVNFSKENGYSGVEGLVGIPGTVGGAICGNAGAFGYEMKDVLVSVEIMDSEGEVEKFDTDRIDFGYRWSSILPTDLILSAEITLKKDKNEDVSAKVEDFLKRKREKQPLSEPSAGCVFKNPPGLSAGRLIDEAGCKGMRIGDVEVSTLHANFFINRGKATASDFMRLMEEVTYRVKEKSGVVLEPEIKIVGRDVD